MGDHFLLNLFGCDEQKLDDEVFIRETLDSAAYCAKMKVLNVASHRFYPQGITCVLLLAESHISIHTWPEEGKAACDVYTCGDPRNAKLACDVIRCQLSALEFDIQHIKR